MPRERADGPFECRKSTRPVGYEIILLFISPASQPSSSAAPDHSRSTDSSATASKREQIPTWPRSYSAGSNQTGSVGQLQEQRGDGLFGVNYFFALTTISRCREI